MANESFARVVITTNDVGDELERYIRATAANGYCILREPIRRAGEGRFARFAGFTIGRWAYETNLRGYFGDPARWHGGDDDRAAWQELLTGLRRTKGSIGFEVVDSEQGNAWLARQTATMRLNWRSAPKITVTTTMHEDPSWQEFAHAYQVDGDVIDADLEFDATGYVCETALLRGAVPTRDELISWSRTRDY